MPCRSVQVSSIATDYILAAFASPSRQAKSYPDCSRIGVTCQRSRTRKEPRAVALACHAKPSRLGRIHFRALSNTNSTRWHTNGPPQPAGKGDIGVSRSLRTPYSVPGTKDNECQHRHQHCKRTNQRRVRACNPYIYKQVHSCGHAIYRSDDSGRGSYDAPSGCRRALRNSSSMP